MKMSCDSYGTGRRMKSGNIHCYFVNQNRSVITITYAELGKHYQKFAKYQRIYRRNISVGNLRLKLPTDTFPSVIQLVTTDGPFSVRNSVGN
jgi:hypothetical protein